MTTDPFKPKIVEKAVEIQNQIKSLSDLESQSKLVKQELEQQFREAIHEMATIYPALLSDEAVGPWLEHHLVHALNWEPDEVWELRETTRNSGAA
jgi:hypothetical protein